VKAYLEDLNLTDKVEIHTSPNMLSAANVVKPSPDGKYIVNLTELPVSEPMVESICDHEIGTHLLRMLNDEHQAWHESRSRYNLGDPWVTEEGFATINTYRSMQGNKIMYPQALKYYATCLGAEMGFVQLYKELEVYVPEAKRRFRLCCRVKRGLVDTAEPGAFNVDQAYFKGAVDILRKMDSINFERLYSGQVALEDLDKVHFLVRKEVLRLPKFLNSASSLKTYLKHCRQMVEDNRLHVSRLDAKGQKPVFIRAAKEFFAKSTGGRERSASKTTTAVEAEKHQMSNTLPVLNAMRLNDLAKPKQYPLPSPLEDPPSPQIEEPRRTVDLQWLAELAKPSTQRAQSEPKKMSSSSKDQARKMVLPSTLWERRLDFLATPKVSATNENSPSTKKDKENDTTKTKTSSSSSKKNSSRDRGAVSAISPVQPRASSSEAKRHKTTGELLMPTPTLEGNVNISNERASMKKSKSDEKSVHDVDQAAQKEHQREDCAQTDEGPHKKQKPRSRSHSKSKCSTTRSSRLNTPRIMPPSARELPVRQELKMGVCVPMLSV